MTGPLRSMCMLALAACGASPAASNVAGIVISPSDADLIVGQTVQLAATATDEAGQGVAPGAVSWSSSVPAVMTVSPDGVVTAVTLGAAVVTAEAGRASASARVKVVPGEWVGPAGARLTSGGATLEIPAAALPTAVPVGLDAQPIGLPLDPMVVGGAAARIPGDVTFATPARLELTYTAERLPDGVAASALVVSRYDGAAWHDVAGSTGSDGKVSAPIVAAGTYVMRMATPTAPCSGPEHRQFDFWLGVWDIHAANGGGGHSEITRDDAGCLVLEHFTEGRVVGRSVNFYSPADRKWHETYVDNQGSRILLSGTLIGGEMVLGTAPARRMSRISWSKLGDEVRQFGEATEDGGLTWSAQFEGFYSPAR